MIARMIFSNFMIHVSDFKEQANPRQGKAHLGSYLISAPLDERRFLHLLVTIQMKKVTVTSKIRSQPAKQGNSLVAGPLEIPELYRSLYEYYLIGRTDVSSEISDVRLIASRAVKDCSWLEQDFSFQRRA